jgi:hypothetical protein
MGLAAPAAACDKRVIDLENALRTALGDHSDHLTNILEQSDKLFRDFAP